MNKYLNKIVYKLSAEVASKFSCSAVRGLLPYIRLSQLFVKSYLMIVPLSLSSECEQRKFTDSPRFIGNRYLLVVLRTE